MDKTFEAGSLTREQFIEWMYIDIHAKKMVVDALERTAARKYWREAQIATGKRLEEFYSKRYKKQSTIDKHVTDDMLEWVEKNQWKSKPREMKSVAWSIKPWENGGCYIISIDANLKERLGKIYDDHVDNKYFKACTGWYIDDNEYVKLVLSEEMQAEWKEDERKLGEAISRFYAGTTYWGD